MNPFSESKDQRKSKSVFLFSKVIEQIEQHSKLDNQTTLVIKDLYKLAKSLGSKRNPVKFYKSLI